MMMNPVLFSYVRICGIENNQEKRMLTIWAKSGDRERQKIVYCNVLYSQIDDQSTGKLLAVAEELTPSQMCSPKHRLVTHRFQVDCKLKNLDPVEELVSQGYRLFTHYIGEDREDIVIAKNLTIGFL